MHSPWPLYAPAELRTLEARGIALLGDDAFALMARAGQAGWRCLLKHWPQAMRIAVVCGPGNNGGDGYVLARHAQESGRWVRVLQAAAPATVLAQRAHAEYVAAGGQIWPAQSPLPECDVLVDAVFGIGLSRAPEAAVAALLAAINAHPAPVLALDVPSGVEAGTGYAHQGAVHAAVTLQFLARQCGLRTGAALDHVGHLEWAGLDLPEAAFAELQPAVQAWRADALAALFPLRLRDSHKGRSGHVLCVGGNHGSGGAVLLAAQAALRSGAGLVSVATRAAHIAPLLARCPEVMAHAVEDAAQLQPLLARADVVAIGPGLGRDDWAQGLLEMVLKCGKPCVVDADALTLLAASGARLQTTDIVTPHPGEAARLLGCSTDTVQRNRFGSVAALQQRLACCVILKGAGTLVHDGVSSPALIAAGNPGMAVAGMGDLLTGCVAAQRAQGMPPMQAATAGALLHAAAGDAAAREDGERGLLPTDLLPWLRKLANPVRR